MPKLYCSVYCDRSFGCSSPKSTMGRKFAQWNRRAMRGVENAAEGIREHTDSAIGSVTALARDTVQLCRTNGVLKNPSVMVVLPPNGGSAWNCSSTNCSIGL